MKLAEVFVMLGADSSGLKTGLDRARGEVDATLAHIVGNFQRAFQTLMGGAALRWAIGLAGQAEVTSIAMNVIIKDLGKTKQLIKELQAFADYTPFDTAEVMAGGKALVQAMVPLNEIEPTLKRLGDLAAGGGKGAFGFLNLIDAWKKMRREGKLSAEVLERFGTSGVDLAGIAQNVAGITGVQFRQMSKEGKLTFATINEWMEKATQGTGPYANAMDKLSASQQGLFSTLKSAIDSVVRAMGQSLMPITKALYTTLIDITGVVLFVNKALFGLPALFVAVGIAIATVNSALPFIIAGFRALAASAFMATIATKGLTAALMQSGWGAVIVGVLIVIVAAWKAIKWGIDTVITSLGALPGVSKAWTGFVTKLSAAWRAFSAAFAAIWKMLKQGAMSILGPIFNWFGLKINSLDQAVGKGLSSMLDTIGDFALRASVFFQTLAESGDLAFNNIGASLAKTAVMFSKIMQIIPGYAGLGKIMEAIALRFGASQKWEGFSERMEKNMRKALAGVRKEANATGEAIEDAFSIRGLMSPEQYWSKIQDMLMDTKAAIESPTAGGLGGPSDIAAASQRDWGDGIGRLESAASTMLAAAQRWNEASEKAPGLQVAMV